MVLAWLGLLAFMVFEAADMFYLGPWGALCVVLILALGTGVAVLIARGNARSGESLIRLSSRPGLAADDLRGHARQIGEVLLCTAIMVDRAGGEALVRQGKVPAGHAGLFRRRTLDLAQRPEIWRRLSSEEHDLLRSQEGAWDWEQVWPRVVRAEDVRVLRWVLGMDSVLTPLEFLEPDLTPVLEVTVKPGSVRGDKCLASYDLRPAQTMSQAMVTRCVGEGLRRGFLTEGNAEVRREYLAIAERLAADESADLLIGAVTVAKADAEKIQWVAQAAIRRYTVLTRLIDYLNGPPGAELKIR